MIAHPIRVAAPGFPLRSPTVPPVAFLTEYQGSIQSTSYNERLLPESLADHFLRLTTALHPLPWYVCFLCDIQTNICDKPQGICDTKKEPGLQVPGSYLDGKRPIAIWCAW